MMEFPGMTVRRQQDTLQSQSHHNGDGGPGVIVYPNSSAPFLHFPAPPDYPPIKLQEQQQRTTIMNRYPDDMDTIEVFVEEQPDCRYSYRGRKSGRNQKCREAQVKWSRNNIAATMERFEPINSPTSEKCQTLPQHFHQDYSYAYYEPGAAMRHSNIPHEQLTQPPPPNSMRALLSKRNPMIASTSSTPSKFSTHENPYEEILGGSSGGSSKQWKQMMDHSMDSLVNQNQNVFKEELKHVQNLHRRVLGELDLSVEAMIMPEIPDDPIQEENDNLAEIINSVVSTEELLSPTGNHATGGGGGDIDSGFSGSSSGASYVGSLRYHRRGSGGGGCSMYGSSSRSSQRSQDDSGIVSFPIRSGSMYNTCKSSSHIFEDRVGSTSTLDPKMGGGKSSFWKKGWKKFPSLSSTSSSSTRTTTTNDNQMELDRTPEHHHREQRRPQKILCWKDYLNIVF